MTAPKNQSSSHPHRVSFFVPWALARLVRTILFTKRKRRSGELDVLEQALQTPCIFVCWHNRLLFLPPCVPRHVRKHITALASQSKDGAYAAAYVAQFDTEMVRGSSSRGGLRALYTLVQEVKKGRSVFLTPDGPRGPRYSVQPGALILAEKSGAPIVPMSVNAPRRWELNSWDKTQILKPFGRAEVVVGKPLHVPAKASSEQRAELAETLRQRLMDITDDSTGQSAGR